MKSILLLAANPKRTITLRLHEEARKIEEGLNLAGYHEISIKAVGAVRPADIRRNMLKYNPQVVHFSGHGAGEEGLVFEDELGEEKLVDSDALAELFQLFAEQVECVVLNACYSTIQAEAIALYIPYVIGMSKKIGDEAAINFSVGFYDALAAGKSFDIAYRFGCNAIRLEQKHSSEYSTPIIWNKGQLIDTRQSNLPPKTQVPNPRGDEDDLSSERGVDYTRLRDLLAQGKWKEADEETFLVMLKVAGREEGRLRVSDIEKFPCTDLRTIDTLWVKYSKARFGFSVQKRIWESVGGTLDADYETYKRFGDRVGWRVDKEWLMYEDLTFTREQPPEGHLPVASPDGFGFGSGFVAARWFGFSNEVVLGHLFSRVETCKL